MLRPTLIVSLLLAFSLGSPISQGAPKLDLWTFWQPSNESSTTKVDHSAWQRFLDAFVTESESGVNLVAYGDVDAQGRALLTGYIDSLTAMDPRQLSRDEQMAYWINLYNALTVEVVLRYPDKDSILRMGESLFRSGPWKDKLITIAGQDVTLDDIEHRILRPIWRDHRIHYAVNCASYGCPNLSTTTFTAENLERQLAAGEHAYVNHARGVSLQGDKLTLSSIYDWYGNDFADDEEGLLKHLAQRHKTLKDALTRYNGRIRYDYDWTPNASSR